MPFITFEGIEGCGKSTQAQRLADRLGSRAVVTREPGGTAIGRAIREVLLDPANRGLTPTTELLLYFSDRAQHMVEVVRPALAQGRIVVCDRHVETSLAYQGYGRGLGLDLIRRLNDEATGGLIPDLTLLLDVPPEVGLSREGAQLDVTGRESLEFHERVREGFLALARGEPERFVVIDATLPEGEVSERALAAVEKLL